MASCSFDDSSKVEGRWKQEFRLLQFCLEKNHSANGYRDWVNLDKLTWDPPRCWEYQGEHHKAQAICQGRTSRLQDLPPWWDRQEGTHQLEGVCWGAGKSWPIPWSLLSPPLPSLMLPSVLTLLRLRHRFAPWWTSCSRQGCALTSLPMIWNSGRWSSAPTSADWAMTSGPSKKKITTPYSGTSSHPLRPPTDPLKPALALTTKATLQCWLVQYFFLFNTQHTDKTITQPFVETLERARPR